MAQDVGHCFADHDSQQLPSRCRYASGVDGNRGLNACGVEYQLRRSDLSRQISNRFTMQRSTSFGQRGGGYFADLPALRSSASRIGGGEIRANSAFSAMMPSR